jgi:protein-S-isoprenylcysteine O-methyltransferase Ste14
MLNYLFTFLLFLTLSPLIIWKLYQDYHTFGKLSPLGGILHVLLFAVHGVFMSICLWGGWSYQPVSWTFFTYLGTFIAIGGLMLTAVAMNFFRTMRKHIGTHPGKLDTSGLYAWSRNPQLVGYGIFLGGLSVIWYNEWVWAGLAAFALVAYAEAIIEEEYLIRLYGTEYSDYILKVPRFLRIG